MEKTTLVSYLFLQGSLRIDAYDTEIHVTDYSTRETISIEGLPANELHQAVLLYIHNLSLYKQDSEVNVKWFKDLIDKANEAIERVQSNDKQTEEE